MTLCSGPCEAGPPVESTPGRYMSLHAPGLYRIASMKRGIACRQLSRPGLLLPSSGSVADVRLLAMADAAPSSGSAAGRVDQAGSEEPVVVARPALCAADLPAHFAVGDGRNGLVALREFVKRWACFPQERPIMIAEAPLRQRWHDRLTSRRHDLVRISAVVHALCDRDGVAVPGWVHKHRSRRPIGLAASLDPTTEWARVALADAPSACAYHDVWFDQAMIENITVHGFRD